MLDDACIEVGRDPHTTQRSVQIGVDYDDLPRTLLHPTAARDAGFTHIVLSLSAPYSERISQTIRDQIIVPAAS